MDVPRPGRCAVVGILNVTPDSFSDGGRFLDLDHAVAHGIAMREAGADLVDVGGESTRPGAARIDTAEELRRVLPVVRDLVADGVPVSIDTTRAAVAEAAVEAGALGARMNLALVPSERVAAVRELVERRFDGVGWRRPEIRSLPVAEEPLRH